MNIAFFDFNGTITQKDTLIDFLLYAVGKKKFILLMIILSPIILLYFLRIFPNWYVKQIVITTFFGGWDVGKFNSIAVSYSLQRTPDILNTEMMEIMKNHIYRGDVVVIVTASCENWVKPWCDREGVDCIATRLLVHEGRITGHFDGRNCYGIEKVNRIREKYDLSKYEIIYAYGDSRGDREMILLSQDNVNKKI